MGVGSGIWGSFQSLQTFPSAISGTVLQQLAVASDSVIVVILDRKIFIIIYLPGNRYKYAVEDQI